MIDAVPSDNQLFDALQAKIKGRIPGFNIRFKNESRTQKLIGKLAFFNKKYMSSYTSVLGSTVWFPSREYVNESKMRAFKVLGHEYVHLLDRKKHPIVFELLYASPQVFVVFVVLALLAFFFSNWWLIALSLLLCALPWPSPGRALLEMRGYAMNLAINIWRHGSLLPETKDWITEMFMGWSYYKMYPFPKSVRESIDRYERYIYRVDTVRPADGTIIFDYSEAFVDVYELLTGIEGIDV